MAALNLEIDTLERLSPVQIEALLERMSARYGAPSGDGAATAEPVATEGRKKGRAKEQ